MPLAYWFRNTAIDGLVAIPTSIQEVGNKVIVSCRFHSTPDAQLVRQKCKERIDSGHTIGLSVGFSHNPQDYIQFKSGKELLSYAKKNNYNMSLFDTDTLSTCGKCQGVIKVHKLYDVSVNGGNSQKK